MRLIWSYINLVRNNRQIYTSGLPSWLRFVIFMKQGVYNGAGWKIRLSRAFCWFGKHTFNHYKYSDVLVDGALQLNVHCQACGHQITIPLREFEKCYDVSLFQDCEKVGVIKARTTKVKWHTNWLIGFTVRKESCTLSSWKVVANRQRQFYFPPILWLGRWGGLTKTNWNNTLMILSQE